MNINDPIIYIYIWREREANRKGKDELGRCSKRLYISNLPGTQEVGSTLIEENGLVVMTGAE